MEMQTAARGIKTGKIGGPAGVPPEAVMSAARVTNRSPGRYERVPTWKQFGK